VDIARQATDDGTVSASPRLTLDEMLASARRRIKRYAPAEAWAAAANGAVLIDIRCAGDRERGGVVPGSLHIPRTVLEWRFDPASPWRTPHVGGLETQILLLCDHGCSSSLAAAALRDIGFVDVGDVVGGFQAWRDAGLPTAPPRDHALAPGELVGMRPPET
jgi:rhodanese-related sulfurtransferase